MRAVIIIIAIATIVSAGKCNEKSSTQEKMKGRLEVAGMCMNYTISLLDGKAPEGAVEPTWTDETTGKKYQNAFRLGNPCDFPSTIKQGDEFYFRIDSTNMKQCALCMAYYPTPSKALFIKVAD
jgi:hypothetical protein